MVKRYLIFLMLICLSTSVLALPAAEGLKAIADKNGEKAHSVADYQTAINIIKKNLDVPKDYLHNQDEYIAAYIFMAYKKIKEDIPNVSLYEIAKDISILMRNNPMNAETFKIVVALYMTDKQQGY